MYDKKKFIATLVDKIKNAFVPTLDYHDMSLGVVQKFSNLETDEIVVLYVKRDTFAPGVWAGTEGSIIKCKNQSFRIEFVDLELARVHCRGFCSVDIRGADIYYW